MAMKVNGAYTVEPNAQLRAVITAWDKIFGYHRQHQPSTWDFLQRYGQRPGVFSSAAGLDGWRPQDVRLLGRVCPMLFQQLASVINVCEASSQWPETWTTGYVAMLPKAVNENGAI